MKKIISVLMLGACVAAAGCSSKEVKQPLYNPNFLSTLFSKDQLPGLPGKLDREIMQPAVQFAQDYDKEYKKLAEQYKEQNELRRQAAAVAEKYLPQAVKLQKEMPEPRDAIIEQYKQAKFAKQYLDNFVNLLDSTVKWPAADQKQQRILAGRIGGCQFNMRNALLGYDHEFKLLTAGKETYKFDLPTFKKIKKGMDYWQIAETFKMPGVHVKSSTVMVNKKPVRQDDWVWQYKSAFVFVTFQGGKAVSFRQDGLW